MAKVVKHQAKDGSLHDSAKACDAHDRKLRIAPAMEKFVNTITGDAPGLTQDINERGDMGIFLTDLPKFLAEHAEQIRDAINNALVTRRPRKAKATPTPKVASSAPAANEPQKDAAA